MDMEPPNTATKTPPQLAPELLDLIVRELDHPRELVPFALANSAFHNVVSPIHIDWRIIECAIDDSDIWDALEANPRRLESIRVLKLHVGTREGRTTVARTPAIQKSKSQPRLLPPDLLVRMKYLQSFAWLGADGRYRLPSSVKSRDELHQYEDTVWHALSSCEDLKEIEATGSRRCPNCAPTSYQPLVSEVKVLQGLSTFRYTHNCPPPQFAEVDLSPLVPMLSACPNLTILELSTTSGLKLCHMADLKSLHFPHLKTFGLRHAGDLDDDDWFMEFLKKHPTIENLSTKDASLAGMSSRSDSVLPNLRSLVTDCPQTLEWLLDTSPRGRRRPVDSVTYKGEFMDNGASTRLGRTLRLIAPATYNLTFADLQVMMVFWETIIQRVASKCPRLLRLAFQKNCETIKTSALRGAELEHEKWISPLGLLPSLMVLTAPMNMWTALWQPTQTGQARNWRRHHAIEVLLTTLPCLRFVFLATGNWRACPNCTIIIRRQDESEVDVWRVQPNAILIDQGRVDSRRWWMYSMVGEEDFKRRVDRELEQAYNAPEVVEEPEDTPIASELSYFDLPFVL